MTPTLETANLILRQLTLADAEAIQTLFPDWEVVKWLAAGVPWPYPADGAETFLAKVLPEGERGERFSWAITQKTDPSAALIGVIELFPNGENDHRGFWLGSAYHGRGFMTEAVFAVTDFAFDVLELPHLLLNNAEANVASHRLKEKAGAEILERKEDDFLSGRLPSIRWRLTREAWQANRQSFLG